MHPSRIKIDESTAKSYASLVYIHKRAAKSCFNLLQCRLSKVAFNNIILMSAMCNVGI